VKFKQFLSSQYLCFKISYEADEFWTYVWKKSSRVWFICAYHRDSGETVAFVRGKRGLKTAKKLKKKLSDSGVNYGSIATDE
jgi:IS1 family transposase